MKNLLTICFLLSAIASFAQKKTEITFKVDGVCGMCEDRIEQALDVPGVIISDWNVESKMLKVAYKTKKISEQQIHQRVADAGHDTDRVKATDEVYAMIHSCCKYRDGASCSGEEKHSHDDRK